MGGNAMHNGIFKSNFTAGKKRENSSAAFGKTAVGNDSLGYAFFSGMMPFTTAKRQATP